MTYHNSNILSVLGLRQKTSLNVWSHSYLKFFVIKIRSYSYVVSNKKEEADQRLYIDIIFLKQEPNIVNVVFEDRSI